MRLLTVAIATAVLLFPAATQGRTSHHHSCNATCRKLRVIHPYVSWLRSTGHCESARYPGGYSLHAGLRAIGGGGRYRGRYQMTFQIWGAVGGHGDPAAHGWLEQAYRAVLVRRHYGRGQWPVCG